MTDVRRFLSQTALSRKSSPIREITTHLLSLPAEKNMISLAGGMPSPSTFPFSDISVGLTDGTSFKIEGSNLKSALQYGKTSGIDKLVAVWTDMMEKLLSPTHSTERRCLVTTGAQLGSYLAMNALINPGDNVLMASPTYSCTLSKAKSMGANIVEVSEDEVLGGLCPKQLRHQLESWPAGLSKPKLLVVCPTGCNPSGSNISDEARQEIYKLSCEHDFLLLEDDPYYFLNYGAKQKSFLAYDTEGRVIRVDSLSKILCPGLRLGFVTAPKPLADIMERHMTVSVLHTCHVSQIITLEYLNHLGLEGFLNHADRLSTYYRSQRDLIVGALEKHMSELATWIVPQAGMFVWVKLKSVQDTRKLAQLAMDNGVVFVPGVNFIAEGDSSYSYIRLAFSVAPAERIDEAIQRLAHSIAQFDNININVDNGGLSTPIKCHL